MLKLHHRRTAITVLLLHHRLHCYPGIRSCIFVSTKSLLCRDPVRKPKGRRWCVWRNTSLLVVFDAHATFIREVESAPKRVFARQKKIQRAACGAQRKRAAFILHFSLRRSASLCTTLKKKSLGFRRGFFSLVERTEVLAGAVVGADGIVDSEESPAVGSECLVLGDVGHRNRDAEH